MLKLVGWMAVSIVVLSLLAGASYKTVRKAKEVFEPEESSPFTFSWQHYRRLDGYL